MVAKLIARLGDTSTHSGTIVTSAVNTWCEGPQVARITDLLACPIHGLNPIVTGSPSFPVENLLCAHTDSITECTARIISGAARSYCEGG